MKPTPSIPESSKVAIVIQFHNPRPSDYEMISFRQCFTVLGKYPIRFVVPASLDTTFYERLAREHGVINLEVVRFNNRYFKSIRGYNKLLTSLVFYKAFQAYDYILLHHTDAFVFRDELVAWCEKGYDLVGPPMYEYDGTASPTNYVGVGTSGFSLKNVATHIRVLKTFRVIYDYKDILRKFRSYNLRGRLYHSPYFLRLLLGLGNNSHYTLNNLKLNDDVVWGVHINRKFEDFNVAKFDEARWFGLEFNSAEILHKMNNDRLPFGCHGWYKPMFREFWKPYIESYGYTVN